MVLEHDVERNVESSDSGELERGFHEASPGSATPVVRIDEKARWDGQAVDVAAGVVKPDSRGIILGHSSCQGDLPDGLVSLDSGARLRYRPAEVEAWLDSVTDTRKAG